MGEFPSGQRGQTVNLLLYASMVRIHLLPPNFPARILAGIFYFYPLRKRNIYKLKRGFKFYD
jgi:hypothetical protein